MINEGLRNVVLEFLM